MTPITRAAIGARVGDTTWRATAVGGLALVGGLAIGMGDPGDRTLAASVAAFGVVVAGFLLVPRAVRIVRGHTAPAVVGGVVLLALAWSLVRRTGGGDHRLPGLRFIGNFWGGGRTTVLPVFLVTLAVTGGLVLIADSLRGRIAAAGSTGRAPWQRLTGGPGEARGVPWRAVVGVLLIAWAAIVGIAAAGRYVADDRALQILLLVLVAGGAAVAIGTPLVIASLARLDRDQADEAREDERQRFAAHLHDSVLQTLALVQRQANDPVAVARLARRQEHALRAWMAGEAELTGETLGAGLRAVVAEVEDEQDLAVELSVIGDRRLDAAGDALAAATREALRNAARHAGPGVRVVVFAELSAAGAEVFVRDEGAGFEPDDVPTERRGIRDAIVGRMSAVGGRATVESAPGEGTEVALKIGRLR